MKAERSEEAAEEKFQASRNWSMKLRERTYLHNIKAQGEATSTDLEGAASYPEHLAKVINKGGFTIQQISRQAKQHLEEDVIWDVYGYRREVNAWLQSFKGQTDSLLRG